MLTNLEVHKGSVEFLCTHMKKTTKKNQVKEFPWLSKERNAVFIFFPFKLAHYVQLFSFFKTQNRNM